MDITPPLDLPPSFWTHLPYSLLTYYLGCVLLHITSEDEMTKKMSWFCGSKFHSNENAEWHYMWLEFNFNWREMKWKLVYKVLKICSSLPSFMIMVLKTISYGRFSQSLTLLLDLVLDSPILAPIIIITRTSSW